MSLYGKLAGVTSDEARQAVDTVFAFVDSGETDDATLMTTLDANVFEIPAVGEVYRAMADGITTRGQLSPEEKESAKMAVAIALTSLTILVKDRRTV